MIFFAFVPAAVVVADKVDAVGDSDGDGGGSGSFVHHNGGGGIGWSAARQSSPLMELAWQIEGSADCSHFCLVVPVKWIQVQMSAVVIKGYDDGGSGNA